MLQLTVARQDPPVDDKHSPARTLLPQKFSHDLTSSIEQNKDLVKSDQKKCYSNTIIPACSELLLAKDLVELQNTCKQKLKKKNA